VRWYVDNRWWWEKILSAGEFREYHRRQYAARLEAGERYAG
jgi:hypothetical protein